MLLRADNKEPNLPALGVTAGKTGGRAGVTTLRWFVKAGAMAVSLLVIYRQQRNPKTYGNPEGICRVNPDAP